MALWITPEARVADWPLSRPNLRLVRTAWVPGPNSLGAARSTLKLQNTQTTFLRLEYNSVNRIWPIKFQLSSFFSKSNFSSFQTPDLDNKRVPFRWPVGESEIMRSVRSHLTAEWDRCHWAHFGCLYYRFCIEIRRRKKSKDNHFHFWKNFIMMIIV